MRRWQYAASLFSALLIAGFLASSPAAWVGPRIPAPSEAPDPCLDGMLNYCTSSEQAYLALMRRGLQPCWRNMPMLTYLLGARLKQPCWIDKVESYNSAKYGAAWTEFKQKFASIFPKAWRAATSGERAAIVEEVRAVTAQFVRAAIAPVYMRSLLEAEKAGKLDAVSDNLWGPRLAEALAEQKSCFHKKGLIYLPGWGHDNQDFGSQIALRTILQFNPEVTAVRLISE